MPAGPNITNIVVLMLENRSYDNLLGWLYHPNNLPPYNQAPAGQIQLEGLTGNETNPNPSGPAPIPVSNSLETSVDNVTYPGTVIPAYDPGELFSDMAQQIFGLAQIPEINPWADSNSQRNMQGFTTNYAALSGGNTVPEANYPDVMNYFTPTQVPVSAFLAHNYAVCDQWFASVPCQTFTNRNFVHCAGPAVHGAGFLHEAFSMVDDLQYLFANANFGNLVEYPSIFGALDKAYPGSAIPNWKLYFQDYSIAMLIVPDVYRAAVSTSNVNVATYDNLDWGNETPAPFGMKLGATPSTFLDDLAAGTLPKFSFIEPRYSDNVAQYAYPPNSNHPGRCHKTAPPTDVAQGEALLAQLYNALRNSEKYWNSTLLIITYDEHGGTYDHVAPPPTNISLSPEFPAAMNIADSSVDGFTFNYFGCRVPAIIVSPWIAAGSTIRAAVGKAPFDHTSIIRTVWDCFGLSGWLKSNSLTARDGAAPSLMDFLSPTPGNSTGPYLGPTLQSSASAPAARPKTPAEARALLIERLTKSLRLLS